ncbi:hypothetical protein K458DRAFT_212504 [Lentithecium fluviatile CBS 122367]|uniref:Uncharacterized protein n=1 Tax=Lentithecium fluviatile CBS 122367 TaxID=1168545 RepID=A0A6G1IBK6_9PLEO|nr:hypothetical protein K458DRAFT_212504 [Lentithecium fluviatile CBS 122367]
MGESRSPAPFPFLELPAELRNRIYEYVLAETQPVSCFPCPHVPDAFNLFRSDGIRLHQGINQMKFVCCQLREETARLGPELYDRIIFPCRIDTGTPASVTCARFLNSLATNQKSRLQSIWVHEQVPRKTRSFFKRFFDLRGMVMLARFADENSNVTIMVLLECFKNHPAWVTPLDVGCIIQWALRKNVVWPTAPSRYFRSPLIRSTCERMERLWKEYGLNEAPFPKNLKVFSAEPIEWDIYNDYRNASLEYKTNVASFETEGI